jgi:hypothetical protein
MMPDPDTLAELKKPGAFDAVEYSMDGIIARGHAPGHAGIETRYFSIEHLHAAIEKAHTGGASHVCVIPCYHRDHLLIQGVNIDGMPVPGTAFMIAPRVRTE